MPTDRLDAAAVDRPIDRSITGTLPKHRTITHPASQAPTAGVPEPLRSAAGDRREPRLLVIGRNGDWQVKPAGSRGAPGQPALPPLQPGSAISSIGIPAVHCCGQTWADRQIAWNLNCVAAADAKLRRNGKALERQLDSDWPSALCGLQRPRPSTSCVASQRCAGSGSTGLSCNWSLSTPISSAGTGACYGNAQSVVAAGRSVLTRHGTAGAPRMPSIAQMALVSTRIHRTASPGPCTVLEPLAAAMASTSE